MNSFSHPALELKEGKPLVYTALSKHLFYFRAFISAFVLEKGAVPLNPFMQFDYYLSDLVDRNMIREANNNLVKRSDELWTFGPISDGVLAEVKIAHEVGMPVKHYALNAMNQIVESSKDAIEMEEDISALRHML